MLVAPWQVFCNIARHATAPHILGIQHLLTHLDSLPVNHLLRNPGEFFRIDIPSGAGLDGSSIGPVSVAGRGHGLECVELGASPERNQHQ